MSVAVALFSIALLALVWVTVVFEARSERAAAVTSAVTQSSNLAVAYEEHVIRTLKALDAITLFVRHEFEHDGLALDLPRYVADGMIDRSLFSILSIVDARGNVILSSAPGAQANYADRDFFRAHFEANSKLYVSKPVLGRVSRTWQIPMSRRITRPDGSFGGVIVLSVDPGYFTRFYQKAELGLGGGVALVGLDGISRARRVGDTLSFGDDMTSRQLMKEQALRPNGTYLDVDAPDGIGRYVSYRTLLEYPLIVAVGTAEAAVFAAFEENRKRQYRIALIASAIIVVFSWLLIAALRRQQRAVTALAEDIAERKRLEAELRELATTDTLTGLPNRRRFLARLEEEHARLKRFDTMQAAVLMLDLDCFKRVNDQYGHAAGDEVLRHFASLLQREVRQIDTASRLGGEEFAVMLPGATQASAFEFAERFRRKVAESHADYEGKQVRVTVSIGITVMTGRDATGETALARADRALYRAKEAGRNRVEISGESGDAG